MSISHGSAAPPSRTVRLVSLDALRGFDMFWIIGAEDVVHALNQVVNQTHAGWARRVEPATRFAAWQLSHKDWAGFGFYDLIFPMFVFMVGASLVFSLTKLIQAKGKPAAVRRVIIRGLILYAFGLIFYGHFDGSRIPNLARHPEQYHMMGVDLRLMGVLQRIALAYLVSGLLFCFLRPRALAVVTVSLLAIYWGVMSFVPAPGVGHVSFEEGRNIANWIDFHILPGYKWDKSHDPEGLLSTIPAIASCLLGVFAGLLLKGDRFRPYLKALILIGAGAAAVGLGFAWGLQFPVIKKLWTSSFVLVAAGYSSILLGLFYLVIDVWKLRAWATPFVWIGMNAITLYMVWNLVKFDDLAQRVVGGKVGHALLAQFEPLAVAALALLFILILARFLYKRQIFLRV